MLPEAVAVRVPEAKGAVACPIFRVPVALLVNVPVPAKAVETVSAFVFETVPLTVKLGIEIVPVIVLDEPDIV